MRQVTLEELADFAETLDTTNIHCPDTWLAAEYGESLFSVSCGATSSKIYDMETNEDLARLPESFENFVANRDHMLGEDEWHVPGKKLAEKIRNLID